MSRKLLMPLFISPEIQDVLPYLGAIKFSLLLKVMFGVNPIDEKTLECLLLRRSLPTMVSSGQCALRTVRGGRIPPQSCFLLSFLGSGMVLPTKSSFWVPRLA